MGKFNGVLLASDFDGTLFTEKGIPEKNIKAIEYFINNGGTFSVVTGRAPTGMIRFRDDFPFNGPFITCNGAVVYDCRKDKLLQVDLIDNSCKAMLKEALSAFPDIGMEVYEGKTLYTINENEYSKRHLKNERLKSTKGDIDNLPKDIHKILFMADNDRLLELKTYIDSKNYTKLNLIFSSSYFMEALDISTNKGTGFDNLCNILKVQKENTYAIGDFSNDIEMLKKAGFSACVYDSDDDVRDVSDIVLCKAQDGAVAGLIKIIDEKRT